MTWNICVIDDSIPVTGELDVDDTVSLNISILKLLLDKNKWVEESVQTLFNNLCSDSDNWNVTAFRHPDIYLRTSEKQNYKPDIIIFDWEYAGFTGDITQKLLEVLHNSFSLVYVYTHKDKDEEVRQELSSDLFDEFQKKRLFLLHKWDQDSVQILLQKATENYEKNFSFRFGRTLRLSTGNAIEEILVGLGKGSMDFVLSLLNDDATQETDIKQLIAQQIGAFLSGNDDLIEELKNGGLSKDKNAQTLIELIRGRIENYISSINLELPVREQNGNGNPSFSKEFWSSRLYYKPSDNIVRKADIVKDVQNNKYYLVVTPDCHLRRLWDKCFGYINLIPALILPDDLATIKSIFSLTRNPKKVEHIFKDFHPNSITASIKGLPEGPIILPFLDINQEHQCLLLLPKAIHSIQIPERPIGAADDPGDRKNHYMTYDFWDRHERIATISEPFATAIVEHCLKAISGYGTPNYPKAVKQEIKQFMISAYDGQANEETA